MENKLLMFLAYQLKLILEIRNLCLIIVALHYFKIFKLVTNYSKTEPFKVFAIVNKLATTQGQIVKYLRINKLL